MIKLYNDLTISYCVVAFTGVFALLDFGFFIQLLWVLACGVVFYMISNTRVKNIYVYAAEKCEVEKALNHLYALYKPKSRNDAQRYNAVNMSTFLIKYGKFGATLKLLLQYDPEKYLKRGDFKFVYYNNISICYYHLGKTDDAVMYSKLAKDALNSPRFPKKEYARLEKVYRMWELIIADGENRQQLSDLLKDMAATEKTLLNRVNASYLLITVLLKHGKSDEAKPYIELIKNYGGDTVYARAAEQNDFSPEFLQKVNDEPWEPKPIKPKYRKTLIISLVLAALLWLLYFYDPTVSFYIRTNPVTHTQTLRGSYINSLVDDLYHLIFK